MPVFLQPSANDFIAAFGAEIEVMMRAGMGGKLSAKKIFKAYSEKNNWRGGLIMQTSALFTRSNTG